MNLLNHTYFYKLILFFSSMELVALLSTGKETWAQVAGLMKYGEWEKIVLLGDDFAKTFKHEKEFEFIQVDLNNKLDGLKQEFSEKFKGKFNGTEVALSIASGTGKEHMALISSLLSLPVGVRFTALTKEGVVDL